MKTNRIFFLFFFLIVGSACDKSIPDPILEAFVPTNLNADAENWKPYILASKSVISVPKPSAVGTVEYNAELQKMKSAISNDKIDKESIAYWGAGAVYRWNEIARELAAKYNKAPASNSVGIYPVPDAANPLADPQFPFANPPYTARMLAYLAAAQYDALISATYYRNLYNRKAPSFVDKSITTALPVSEQGSYPSQEAVVSGASFVILSAMFPGEIPYLESKIKEANNARLAAGLNLESDILEGEKLGKAVAGKVIDKAKTDGMGAANNQSLVQGQIAAAKIRGISTTWLSQENPARPPMLPNYGAVNTWNFDRGSLAILRPKLPYVAGSAEWQKEKEELEQINKKQSREQARIANYWADGAGSYTPPGHWNRMAANLAFEKKMSEAATARTLVLVGTALMDAGIACWETKYYYYTPRPQQFGIKTSVGLPNFPSYTSGHSTFSAAAAAVLSFIFPEKSAEFTAKAKEASESRIYGLIHFRSDCEMGLEHGKKIGELAIKRAEADGYK
jgi:hypothetical protein